MFSIALKIISTRRLAGAAVLCSPSTCWLSLSIFNFWLSLPYKDKWQHLDFIPSARSHLPFWWRSNTFNDNYLTEETGGEWSGPRSVVMTVCGDCGMTVVSRTNEIYTCENSAQSTDCIKTIMWPELKQPKHQSPLSRPERERGSSIVSSYSEEIQYLPDLSTLWLEAKCQDIGRGVWLLL